MRARRALSLLAALALMAPLAAVASPVCAPGPHCPMAGLMGEEMPCHGTSIDADNCCLTDGAAEPAGIVPVISATAVTVDQSVPAPLGAIGQESCPLAGVAARSAPLYRLFRALLI